MAADDAPQSLDTIDKLEKLTRRRIGIDYSEHEADGKFNNQSASPLFSLLPRELRDLIWAFATAPFEDPTAPFEENAYYYRPGHTAHLKTDTTLLRTCRRIWLEANAFPMLQAEHSFYYDRAAPDKRDPQWMGQLTAHNRQNFGQLHLFVQMFKIEGLTAGMGMLRNYFLKTLPVPGDFQPRVFHVTLRHTDWWNWESDEALFLEDGWVEAMLNSPDLRSTQIFKLELETLDYKEDQLMSIVDRIKQFESEEFHTHVIDGKEVKTKFVLADEEQKTYTWEGPANLDNETWDPYEGKGTLKYHVVTLTWRLRFPELPGAFVPQLRRGPRIRAPDVHSEISDMNKSGRRTPLDSLYMAYDPAGGRTTSTGWNVARLRWRPAQAMQRYQLMQRVGKKVRQIS
ncbi:hypothetical protein B0A55_12871, partial [Friedmanniomyces simplex]